MLLLCLTMKTYLSPQLLVYLPIDVPVHDPTCSFSYFHSEKPLLTHPLNSFSTYSWISAFINPPVQFIIFLLANTYTLSVNWSTGLHTSDPPENKPTCSSWCYFLLANHEGRSVTWYFTPSQWGWFHQSEWPQRSRYLSNRCTHSSTYLFILTLSFQITAKICLSTHLMFYI